MNHLPMDLITLRLVVAVADCGSISAGSDRVRLALGAASARISSLEAATGVRIFERSSRGVLLTPTGHMLVQRSRELLADADRLAVDLRDYSQGFQGHVRVLSNASAILEMLPERLTQFARSHPHIRVDVEERPSPEIPLALLDGRADLGIVDIAHPLTGLEFQDLGRDTLVLVVPAGSALANLPAIALQDALTEDFICLTDGNALTTRLTAAAARIGQPIRMRMQMRSFDGICRMVAGGLGVGVLPIEALGPQLATLPIKAIALSDEWATRRLRLALREGVLPSAATRHLMKSLLAPAGT
ncbi:MAG: LysR family transcriptional regulator [Burkholderiaceae bacterium]